MTIITLQVVGARDMQSVALEVVRTRREDMRPVVEDMVRAHSEMLTMTVKLSVHMACRLLLWTSSVLRSLRLCGQLMYMMP